MRSAYRLCVNELIDVSHLQKRVIGMVFGNLELRRRLKILFGVCFEVVYQLVFGFLIKALIVPLSVKVVTLIMRI